MFSMYTTQWDIQYKIGFQGPMDRKESFVGEPDSDCQT
jgi:hypothetical protein